MSRDLSDVTHSSDSPLQLLWGFPASLHQPGEANLQACLRDASFTTTVLCHKPQGNKRLTILLNSAVIFGPGPCPSISAQALEGKSVTPARRPSPAALPVPTDKPLWVQSQSREAVTPPGYGTLK